MTNVFEKIESDSFADIGVSVLWVDRFEDIPKVLRQVAGLPRRWLS